MVRRFHSTIASRNFEVRANDWALSIRTQIMAWIFDNSQWRMEQPFRGFWENRLTLQVAPKLIFEDLFPWILGIFAGLNESAQNVQEICELLNFWNEPFNNFRGIYQEQRKFLGRCFRIDCEQSLFCSKIRRENERDGMRDIRAASGEAASRD